MGVTKVAIGDAILTSVWVFGLLVLRILAIKITAFVGLQFVSIVNLFITPILNTCFVLTIRLIGRALGGASFNPSVTVSFYAAGLRPNSSLTSMAIRFPAQAIGGVIGARLLLLVIPTQYNHMLKGPLLKVDLHTGAMVEGVLTFIHNLINLSIMLKGPKNPFLKVYLFSVATVILVVLGSGFTGPSLNPANAFGWAYANNKHNTWEQFYVYWICPFVGATLAALVYRFLFISSTKQKKA
ncbi:aquaporin SIP1-1-like [Abrus precatorius]|uniref:Aquaporin SIP1-1-like n=1 Tax=Abrus precatorius TaxID=3816 RepID=A0A8B8KX46_ABRPR|nr:aquaporin SIP1-1-like [Abrus precatorius]